MLHVRVKIYGQVQGVFFRAAAKEKANKFNVTGFIMNEPDGAVYIEAEGEKDNLEKFLNWCHKGPQGSKVERIDYQEHNELKNFKNFKIVHEYPDFK